MGVGEFGERGEVGEEGGAAIGEGRGDEFGVKLGEAGSGIGKRSECVPYFGDDVELWTCPEVCKVPFSEERFEGGAEVEFY